MFPTEIDVESMFTCQTALHLWFCVFHLCERILKFMIVCKTASLRTVFPRTVIPHTSVFHENDDASVSVTKCPTDQKSSYLSSLILLRTRTRSQNPTTLFGALSLVCASCGVIFIVPPSLKSTSFLQRSSGFQHRNVLRPQLSSVNVLSVLAHAALQVRSLDSVQLLSLLLAVPVFPAVLCTTSRRHCS